MMIAAHHIADFEIAPGTVRVLVVADYAGWRNGMIGIDRLIVAPAVEFDEAAERLRGIFIDGVEPFPLKIRRRAIPDVNGRKAGEAEREFQVLLRDQAAGFQEKLCGKRHALFIAPMFDSLGDADVVSLLTTFSV